MKLNIHQFLPVETLSEIFTALKALGESRLVGGCVREMLLGAAPKDIDIATQVRPDDVMKLLRVRGYKCIPTGIKYGTITAIKDSYKFEITTLRSDIATYGRRADVVFTKDFRLDAERRDFTFNALYMDLSGDIQDFFGGILDLNAKLLRFIGDPEARIKEDYLRILRYFRFYSYYENKIDIASLNACANFAPNLTSLSGERIRDEILKILTAPYAKESLALMQKHHVIQEIIPYKNDIDFTCFAFCEDGIVNLSAILKRLGLDKTSVNLLMNKIKLSNAQKAVVSTLLWEIELNLEDSEINHKEVLYYFGVDVYSKYILFLKALHSEAEILSIQNFNLPNFPVNGGDLLKFGLAGKEIGSKLSKLKKLWIESDFKLTKAKLLEKL